MQQRGITRSNLSKELNDELDSIKNNTSSGSYTRTMEIQQPYNIQL